MLKISKSRPEKFHLTQNVSQMVCFDAKRVENVFMCRVFFTAVIRTLKVLNFQRPTAGHYKGLKVCRSIFRVCVLGFQ